jgi:hypothetical protein
MMAGTELAVNSVVYEEEEEVGYETELRASTDRGKKMRTVGGHPTTCGWN